MAATHERLRSIVADGNRATSDRVRFSGTVPVPEFGTVVRIASKSDERDINDPELAVICSGPTMVCRKCGAIGAGFHYGQAHPCGGEWLPATMHPSPTWTWHDRHAEVLMSDRWKQLRAEVLKSQDGKCRCCDERKGLQMHHLHYRTLGDETARDVEILCAKHHAAADRYREYESAFDTWHTKKYGEDAEVLDYQQQEFGEWLERKAYYR